MTIGEKIYTKRKELNLTQEELAIKVNTTRQAVSKWELNESIPETEKLNAIAKALNITLDELLNSDEEFETKTSTVDEVVSDTYNLVKKHRYKVGYYLVVVSLCGLVFFSVWMSVINGMKNPFGFDPEMNNSFSEFMQNTPFSNLLNGFSSIGVVMIIVLVALLLVGIYFIIKDIKIKR